MSGFGTWLGGAPPAGGMLASQGTFSSFKTFAQKKALLLEISLPSGYFTNILLICMALNVERMFLNCIVVLNLASHQYLFLFS